MDGLVDGYVDGLVDGLVDGFSVGQAVVDVVVGRTERVTLVIAVVRTAVHGTLPTEKRRTCQS